ncbi:MAG TPA: TerB family tellurite resistance protein [Burkholderiaceae bacterium]|nr:TerB family tellurite resistance protein [Burkholderiaceae bacterium]
MRPYPQNSPRAAGRIVALTLLADGRLEDTELSCLEAMHGHERLGLRRYELHAVVQDFCADLVEDARAARDDDCRITPALIELLLADIDDVSLQRRVLALCAGVARADGRMHDNESIVIDAALRQWGIAAAAQSAQFA